MGGGEERSTEAREGSRGTRLPLAERVVIDPRKLKDYLLSPDHQVGGPKAAFFARLGFSRSNWRRLEIKLRRLAREVDAELGERTPFGQKYVVRGMITGLTGRRAEVIAVWIVEETGEAPRLVTVYPGG
jgi:hypothetical protein